MRCSLAGLRIAFTNESAFRQEVALAAVLIPAAVVLPFSAIERFLLVGAVLLVLIVELLNTAIEIALDRISTDQHRLTGAAKDIGSAAVLLSFIVMAIAWASIAAPVILGLILQSF
jgi:diacylglycerol kinase (ATP)